MRCDSPATGNWFLYGEYYLEENPLLIPLSESSGYALFRAVMVEE